MIDPIADEKFERGVIKDVRRIENGYDITKEDGWSFFLSDHRNKINAVPTPGDEIIVYGDGIGYQIMGLQINSALVWFEDRAEKERKHNLWVEETTKRYKKEYLELMEKIKDEAPFETVDVSGMGGGYERVCQLMIQAGVEYLKDREFHFDYQTYEGIYGICTSDAPWSKGLEKALMKASGGDCTGAMHQCVIGHLTHIYKLGYDGWLNEFPEERRYMYPSELPESSFGRDS